MRTIKKYGNRRLYDTETSAYVNVAQLADVIRAGDEVRVVDAGTGDDLTRGVLLQILTEAQGAEVLPVGLLHRMIRFTADSPTQRAALRQIGVGLELLDQQLAQAESQWPWMRAAGARAPFHTPASTGSGAPETVAEGGEVYEPGRRARAPGGPRQDPEPPPVGPSPVGDPELDELRARLAALEGRLKGPRSR